MTDKPEDKDGQALLELEDSISVYEAAVVRDKLVAFMDASESLRIDLSKLEDCDITGIQLLYSAKKTAEDKGKSFSVTGASPAVVDVMARAGINADEVLCTGKEE